MKTTRTLRLLSLLGFLLLLAPFYDHCNGERMKEAETTYSVAVDTTSVEVDTAVIDTTEINKMGSDTVQNSFEKQPMPFLQKAYEFIDDEDSENAYEIASLNGIYFKMSLGDFFDEMKGSFSKDKGQGIFFLLKNICFAIIIISTFLILIFSFKRIKSVHRLSRLNLILLSVTVICLFLEGLFESISQIKWGYYTFIITNLLIFYHSNPNKIKT